MVSPPRDFESRASTNSAIPAGSADYRASAGHGLRGTVHWSPIIVIASGAGRDELAYHCHGALRRVRDHAVPAPGEALEARNLRRQRSDDVFLALDGGHRVVLPT